MVAAAVVMPQAPILAGVTDSKLLSDRRRRQLFQQILVTASAVGVGAVWQEEIDQINILQATLVAMSLAVAQLQPLPDCVLVDGNQLPVLTLPALAIVDGDLKSYSVAAAAIVAKVMRDNLMVQLDRLYPCYGFARHKGYGTREHQSAIRTFGPCSLHRRSFSWGTT